MDKISAMAEELVAEMVINGGLAANIIADQQMIEGNNRFDRRALSLTKNYLVAKMEN